MSDGRRRQLEKVRAVILKNLPDGFEETISWGMITYQVPLTVYPDTYNKQPMMYAALASKKNHMAIYLNGIYTSDKLREDFLDKYRASGKRMDIAKSCVRFKGVDDLPLELIGEAIAAVDVDTFVNAVKQLRPKR